MPLTAGTRLGHLEILNPIGLFVARGRFEEALAENRRALELDPLALIMNAARGWVHFFRRDFEAAIDTLRKAIALDETFAVSHVWLSWALIKAGRFPEAIAEAQQGVTLSGVKADALAAQPYVHAATGD